MFQFPRFPRAGLCVQPAVLRHDAEGVAPFGDPRINARSAAPRGVSSPCRVLHRLPAPRHPPRALSRLARARAGARAPRSCVFHAAGCVVPLPARRIAASRTILHPQQSGIVTPAACVPTLPATAQLAAPAQCMMCVLLLLLLCLSNSRCPALVRIASSPPAPDIGRCRRAIFSW